MGERETLINRLKEAGLSTKRFLKVAEDKAAFELEWQNKLYTPEELGDYPRWGISGGGGLVLIDTDTRQMTEIIQRILPPTLEVISPRRKLPQFYFNVIGGQVPNRVLKLPNTNGGVGEIRAQNYYLVAPGTTIKYKDLETGEDKEGTYKILHDRPITEVAFDDFMATVSPYTRGPNDQHITYEKMQQGVSAGERHAIGIRYAVLLIKAIKLDPATALLEMKRWNQLNKPPMSEKDLERMVRNAVNYSGGFEQSEKTVSVVFRRIGKLRGGKGGLDAR